MGHAPTKINGLENWAPINGNWGEKKWSGMGPLVRAHFVDALGAQIYVDKLNLEKDVESLKVKKLSQQTSTKFSQSKSQFFFGGGRNLGFPNLKPSSLDCAGRMRLALFSVDFLIRFKVGPYLL